MYKTLLYCIQFVIFHLKKPTWQWDERCGNNEFRNLAQWKRIVLTYTRKVTLILLLMVFPYIQSDEYLGLHFVNKAL